ncbi:hypothetical protein P4O66_008878, partial [Electrophorus voltai]
ITAFDELQADFKVPIDQGNPLHARERLRNIERICCLLRKVRNTTPQIPHDPIRYFHSPTDTKELLYDPAYVMNGDTLRFCQKEAWCKMSFFVLSFFYYLYWWVPLDL